MRIEAASHELFVRFDAPAVSVRFEWGSGHVYHVISHLWLKRTSRPARACFAEACARCVREGRRRSEESIYRLLSKWSGAAEEINFATLQSAATSTELVAQLCIEAVSKSASGLM